MHHDPFVRRPLISRLSVLGAALALMLAIAMPLLFHMRITDDRYGHWELLVFIVYLSSLPAFVLAGRRPFAGGVWLLCIGAIVAVWLNYMLVGPFYAELIFTQSFWPADLLTVFGMIFLVVGWVNPQLAKPRKASRDAHRTRGTK